MTDKRIRIILDNSQAKRAAKDTDDAVKGLGRSADSAQFSFNKLAAAIAAAISVQQIVQYADAYTRVQNQLRRTTQSQDELARSTALLLGVANETRAGIETTTELYTSLSVSTRNLGKSQEEILGVTKTINNLFLESGKGASETAGAIRQLGQALESGALRGDEFNSVAEGAPGILRAVEKQTGLTRAELRELAADGKITAQLLVESLENYSEAAQEAADKTRTTLDQALAVSGNNITFFVGSLDEAIGATAALSSGIIQISSALADDSVIKATVQIFEFLAVVIGARLTAAVVSSTVAFIAQTAAALRGTVTMNAMGQVIARTTVATNALALASRAGAAALALLGGPVGILALVATSLIFYSSKAKEAADVTEILTSETDNLTNAQKELLKLNINKSFDEQIEIIKDAKREIETLGKFIAISQNPKRIQRLNDELVAQKARLDEARISAERLTEKLAKLVIPRKKSGGVIVPPTPAVEPTATTSEPGFDIGAREIAQAQSITQQLQNELNLRLQISDIYRQKTLADDASLYEQQLAAIQAREAEELARLQSKAIEEQIRRDEQFRQALESDKIKEEERKILREEQDAQRLLAEQILEQERTAILEQGVKARMELDKAERESRLANAGALGSALINLGQGQSKKIFKIGQTLALAQAAVALPTAVLESFKNGGGYPWGLVPAGAMLATGLKNIQQIKSAGSGLGGGGGGSVSVPSLPGGGGTGGPQIPTNTNSPELQQQRRIIELRGVSPGDMLTGEQVASIFESDDNVIVAFENARADAQRRNVTGITAR